MTVNQIRLGSCWKILRQGLMEFGREKQRNIMCGRVYDGKVANKLPERYLFISLLNM